ncbi:hypothetical protein CR152_24685 [Massilia violaceinigra]|uniref:Uncharacterized protein n=1 Tax=Massilia violaceinigra TaxID=2045208 RepID=A0A2D2DQX8_9BURK|nr:hypothetical protein CR152_24685 [Massilia violaceinigra]
MNRAAHRIGERNHGLRHQRLRESKLGLAEMEIEAAAYDEVKNRTGQCQQQGENDDVLYGKHVIEDAKAQ